MTQYEDKILALLCREVGLTSREVADKLGHIPCGLNSRASQSALVMQSLKRLEKRGLVKRLDDKLPIAWVLANERGIE